MSERVLLGVTGSIAAYKAPMLLRALRNRGFRVPVVLTDAAQKFVGRVTFEALTEEGVYTDLWARREALSHISLLEDTRLVLVAPATANIIAKAACGLADDLLSSLLLAAEPSRIMFAPAMNEGMWNNPATRKNISTLVTRGVHFVEPGSGELACGVVGKGRLAEPDDITFAAERLVRTHPSLAGKRVVVTTGRTEEEIDPVRVLTNRSSGRMGVEIARAFSRAGAEVTLVAGEVGVELPRGIKTLRARTAQQMLAELSSLIADTDVLVMTAAVGDYSPVEQADGKIKDAELTIQLAKTPDILASLPSSNTLRVGFSVESGTDWKDSAAAKLRSKRLDAIVANPVEVIGSPNTRAMILDSGGGIIEVPPCSKAELASAIVEMVTGFLKKREHNA